MWEEGERCSDLQPPFHLLAEGGQANLSLWKAFLSCHVYQKRRRGLIFRCEIECESSKGRDEQSGLNLSFCSSPSV